MLRCPVFLYRLRLGWLLGHRFVLLTHRGRMTGSIHRTVLEIVRYDHATRECVVASGWGHQSDWYRNLKAHPALSIETGRDRYVPEQRFLTADEGAAELQDYERQHPQAARMIGRYLGMTWDGSETALHALAATLPMVLFRPGNGAHNTDPCHTKPIRSEVSSIPLFLVTEAAKRPISAGFSLTPRSAIYRR